MYKYINTTKIILGGAQSNQLKRHMVDKTEFSILSHIGLPPKLSIPHI